MKKISTILLISVLFVGKVSYAQNTVEENPTKKVKKTFYFETGVNASLPVHIQMYRSHRLGIGVNARVGKTISNKLELGIRLDYDYRFIKKNSRILTPESSLEERAVHNNFSLICIKPNIQYNMNSNWFMGAESGMVFAISDEDPKIGMGFVSEYASDQQFGICSGLYVGKYFLIHSKKNKLGISMNLIQFLALGHAENSLGFKINYRT